MATLATNFLTLTARDLMSRDLVTIDEDASLVAAAELFGRKQISGVPVVNANGDCVGVVSATDIAMRMEKDAATDASFAADPFYRIEKSAGVPEGAVREWMTPDSVTVPPDETVDSVAQKMLDAHIHRVVVVDESCRPQGVVSTMDILAAIVRLKHSERSI